MKEYKIAGSNQRCALSRAETKDCSDREESCDNSAYNDTLSDLWDSESPRREKYNKEEFEAKDRGLNAAEYNKISEKYARQDWNSLGCDSDSDVDDFDSIDEYNGQLLSSTQATGSDSPSMQPSQ